MPNDLAALQKQMASFARPGKWGWRPEMQKIAGLINRETRKNFQRHASPDGRPWPTTEAAPDPSVLHIGRKARIGGREFTIRSLSEAQAIADFYNRSRKSKRKYTARATPKMLKPKKALYRRGVKRMAEKMTKKSARDHVQYVGRDSLEVGGRGRGLVKNQLGSGAIPARPFQGMTADMVSQATEIIATGIEKRLAKGLY